MGSTINILVFVWQKALSLGSEHVCNEFLFWNYEISLGKCNSKNKCLVIYIFKQQDSNATLTLTSKFYIVVQRANEFKLGFDNKLCFP
jgi:hypothetical protein